MKNPFQISWFRRISLSAVWTLGILALLLFAAVLLVRTMWGKEQLKSYALFEVGTYLNGDLRIEKLEGDPLTGLTLKGVSLYQEGKLVAKVPKIVTRYRLRALLQNRLQVREMDFYQPYFQVWQRADSSWNVVDLLKPRPKTEPSANPLILEIGRARVFNGRAKATFINQRTLELQKFDGQLADFFLQKSVFSGKIQDLWSVFKYSDRKDAIRLGTSTDFSNEHLWVKDLRLHSDYSNLTGKGYLDFPVLKAPSKAHFSVRAQPFAFKEIAPFFPFLNAEESLRMQLKITAPNERFAFQTNGRFKSGAHFALEGNLSPYESNKPLLYRIKGDIADLNVAHFTLNPAHQSKLTAFVDVDAKGTAAQTLAGDFLLNLQPGSWGKNRIQAVTLSGDILDGKLQYDLFGKVNEAYLKAEGWVRPFDKEIAYYVTGEAKSVDVQQFVVVKGLKSTPLSGVFNFSGKSIKRLPQGDFDLQTNQLAYQNFAQQVDLNLSNPMIRGNIVGNQIQFDGVLESGIYHPQPNADAVKVQRMRFDGTWKEGTLQFNANSAQAFYRSDISAENVAAQGTYRDGAAKFQYQVQAAQYTQNIGANLLSGTGTWQNGRGVFDVNGANGFIKELLVEDLPFVSPKVNFIWQNQQGNFQFSSALPNGGHLSGDGKVFPASETVQINQAEISGLSPKYVRSNLENGRLNANITSFKSVGFNPKTMQLEGISVIQPSTYGDYRIQRGDLAFSMQNGALQYRLDGLLEDASLFASGTLYPLQPVPRYVVTDGRFANLNPDRFSLEGGNAGNLNGRFQADLSGLDPTKLDGNINVQLDHSQFQTYELKGGNGDFVFDKGNVRFDLAATTADGNISFQGSANPFAPNPTVQLQQGTLRNFNLAQWTNNPALESRLNGTFKDANIQFQDFNHFIAELDLQLSPSKFRKMHIAEGKVQLYAIPENLRLNAFIRDEKGRFTLQADGKVRDNQPDYRFEGALERFNVAGLTDSLAFTNLNLRFAGNGFGIDPQTMQLAAQITGTRSRVDDIFIDSLQTQVQLQEGVAIFGETRLTSNVIDLNGAGSVAYGDFTPETSDFNFTANLKDLNALARYAGVQSVDAEGMVNGRVMGGKEDLRMRIETAGDGLSLIELDDLHIGTANGNITAEFIDNRWNFDGKLRTQNISIPGYIMRNADFRLEVRDSLYTFDGAFSLDERLAGNARMALINQPQNRRLNLEALRFTLLGDDWRLVNPVEMAQNADGIVVKDLRLETENAQQIYVDGTLNSNQSQQIKAQVKNLKLDGITDILRFDGLNGTLTGSLNLAGTLQEPTFTADFRLQDLKSHLEQLGMAEMDLVYENRKLLLNGGLIPVQGDTLNIVGALPLVLNFDFTKPRQKQVSQSEGDLRVSSDAFPLNWLNPFFDANTLDGLEGMASIDMQLRGNLTRPEVTGTFAAQNVKLALPFNGTRYQNGQMTGAFIGDKIQVKNLTIQTPNRGTVNADGTIKLATIDKANLDLNLNAQNFELINTELFRGRATGAAHLSGTLFKPVLRSDSEILLDEFNVYLNSQLIQTASESVALSQKDLRRIEADFGRQASMSDTTTVSFYNATDIDLRIRSNGNTWLRSKFNPRMDILLTGSLEIKKPYKGIEDVRGSLSTVKDRSKIVFGRTFDLQSGTLRFNGDMFNPVFENFLAEYQGRTRQQGITQKVQLTLKGDFENPDFQFTADPAMDEVQILAYLANGGASGQDIATDFLAQYGSNLLESIAADELPFDLVEIRIDEKSGAPALRIGKYIARKWFVSAESAIGRDLNNLRFLVDYQQKQWLLYQLDYGNTFVSAVDNQTVGGNKLGFFVLMEYVY